MSGKAALHYVFSLSVVFKYLLYAAVSINANVLCTLTGCMVHSHLIALFVREKEKILKCKDVFIHHWDGFPLNFLVKPFPSSLLSLVELLQLSC